MGRIPTRLAVASLVATPEAARRLDRAGRTIGVPAADVPPDYPCDGCPSSTG